MGFFLDEGLTNRVPGGLDCSAAITQFIYRGLQFWGCVWGFSEGETDFHSEGCWGIDSFKASFRIARTIW